MVGNLDLGQDNKQDMSPELQALQTPEGELYLRFHLPSKEEFALPAVAIREVMQQSPERITPIPNASPLLLGTLNLRGQVIWVADLGQFLGNTVPLRTDRPEIPVIAVEEQETILGLAIDQLGDMEWLDIEQLQAPTNVADHIAPYVQGEWVAEEQSHQVLRLLDQVAILRSARWAT
ncbi:probable chemotaxis protein [Crocosphaera subtropica ATCC 51142]|uniref:Probable chemotaxis protein n=1 Tax=Crocosphaera subtropica (strain ATCC 51142 / BH68) TaxID=43989 RepID=B1WNF4_CROS5|nr:chemotaxis protein CheW [Crocosphaera subtropica]ACB49796.1 probable chemotaxis protein [Crocosphaera subtropica ATCC 51142]